MTSKAYRLFNGYSVDTEIYKRDYSKAEAVLRHGIFIMDHADLSGGELLLKEYVKFGVRMIERIKRDIYKELSRDAWSEWLSGRFHDCQENSWSEYEKRMLLKAINFGTRYSNQSMV